MKPAVVDVQWMRQIPKQNSGYSRAKRAKIFAPAKNNLFVRRHW
jgi:hypothetical protein